MPQTALDVHLGHAHAPQQRRHGGAQIMGPNVLKARIRHGLLKALLDISHRLATVRDQVAARAAGKVGLDERHHGHYRVSLFGQSGAGRMQVDQASLMVDLEPLQAKHGAFAPHRGHGQGQKDPQVVRHLDRPERAQFGQGHGPISGQTIRYLDEWRLPFDHLAPVRPVDRGPDRIEAALRRALCPSLVKHLVDQVLLGSDSEIVQRQISDTLHHRV
ncbi:MAG: hypothetical protein RIC87_08590 [Kiloniellales bacterium]